MHLTYCSNVHSGESLADLKAVLRNDVVAVRAAYHDLGGGEASFPIGLRIAAEAASALSVPGQIENLRDLLACENLQVRTLNGFPYGAFHKTAVKSKVYEPDWSTQERLTYTNQLSDVMAAIVPSGEIASISTLPVTFKPWASEDRIDAAVDNLIAAAVHAQRLFDQHGMDITIAIEPEPCCYLETAHEAIEFFNKRLFASPALKRFSNETGLFSAAAEEILRRRLSLCFDVCHGAVEFETPSQVMALLHGEGIRIAKIQLSAALKAKRIDGEMRARLAGLSEPVYLHQVVARRGGELIRYEDIPDALADDRAGEDEEWRVHFHVPIFLDQLDGFYSTQDALLDAINAQKRFGYADHLEVETYTWSVLPKAHQADNLASAIARELTWAQKALTS